MGGKTAREKRNRKKGRKKGTSGKVKREGRMKIKL